MADEKKKTAEDKKKKKKALLRRLREFLVHRSSGTSVGLGGFGSAKEVRELVRKESEGK